MNPLTWIVAAASSWIVVLGINELAVSVAVALFAQLIAMFRLRNLSVLAATAALSIPVGLSMLIIHVPFGRNDWSTALELSVRFIALMSAFLAAASAITVADLVKSLSHMPRVAYIVGSAVQLLPQGRDTLASVRYANHLRALSTQEHSTRSPLRTVKFVVLPLITRLLSAGAARAIPLEVSGLERTGRRTVLNPVKDTSVEKVLRWFMPAVALVVVVCL
ncbi:energy-coupling factor transporter transmembrane protein EcfT [Corynebacterium sp.]|uniref:energy-coupling factor transporter transmembrane protein EcfT n=1 Tax=Corynebacterium sp. TaxID=1720 RepID=UPI0028A6899C|nr:energy-coupling factor transporter transmembrane protein EcfT [Corynebacterium sp.]